MTDVNLIKENLKKILTKEKLTKICIGIVLTIAMISGFVYAWHCGDKAYAATIQVEDAINIENASETSFGVINESIESAVTTIMEEKEAAAKAEEEAAAAKAALYSGSYSGNSGYYNMPSSGLTMQSGVNYYDGRRETYYSSNVLYHYRTGEWTVDSEGFYRDANGYYVVAASDMAQGTTFEGSKGTCIVLDSGCAGGTTDYYVAW